MTSTEANRPRRPRLPRRPRTPQAQPAGPQDRAPLRALGAVAAVVVVVVGAGTLLRPEPVPPAQGAAVVEPVGSVSVVCPEPGAAEDLGVRLTAAVVPDLPGQDREGLARIVTLPGDRSASAKITVPGGQTQLLAYGIVRPPAEGVAVGGLAPGFVADQWSRDPQGEGRGLASLACAPATASAWYVGGGATVGRRTRILLVNVEDTAAQVDVLVFGPDGPIEAPAGRGVVVRPGSRQVLRLDALVPGAKATAIHVLARTGRVASAVSDIEVKGLEALGSDWIPPSTAPDRTVLVPGVSDGPGPRLLSILAPGDADAAVSVRVLTGEGTFAPVGLETIDAPAGQVVTVDLATALEGQSATVELRSDQPVVAGLRQRIEREGELVETFYSTGAPLLTGPAAVTNLPATRDTRVRLSLTAPSEAAAVDVALLPYDGGDGAAKPTGRQTVEIGAGKVVNVDLPVPTGVEWYTAVVRPREGSGPIVAAHRVVEPGANGLLVTGYPWSPLRVVVLVPDARENLGVALPD